MTDFQSALNRLAAKLAPGAVAEHVRRLSGGASQETWSFDAGGRGLILRRAPGGGAGGMTQAIGLAAEADVIRAARAAGAPTPEVLHVCGPQDELGAGYVMARLEGETIARRILRDDGFAAARAGLARQCGAALAAIHATPRDALPPLPVNDALAQLDQYEEVYRSFDAPRPIFDLAFQDLRRNAPSARAPVLTHGDFRLGNLMVGPDGLIAALDWELAHFGDPAEDLGWICVPSWRFGGLDAPVGGFGAIADLLAGYRAAGGPAAITEADVRYWARLGALKWGVMCLMMYRAFDSGLDRSVERAAIGRRASETELDLILMMRGRL